ncbi:MAG: hypothetical protein JSU73_05060, partial [candidate division WOR-3 bacterium]
MKYSAALLLVLGVAAGAVDPYVSLKVSQPWDEGVQELYRVLPDLGVGVRFPRTSRVAIDLGLTGTYAAGVGEFSDMSLWDLAARFGAEFMVNRALGWYMTPGVLYMYAQETAPYVDDEHNIITRTHGGGAIGFFGKSGLMLLREGDFHLNFEAGMDLVAVPTYRERIFEYTSTYWLPMFGFNLGLVAG